MDKEEITNFLKTMVSAMESGKDEFDEVTMWRTRFMHSLLKNYDKSRFCYARERFMHMPSCDFIKKDPEDWIEIFMDTYTST